MALSLVLLPQVSGYGYYSYTKELERQYGTQALIDTIIEVGLQWMWNSTFEFGVGDMSFQSGGTMAPHKSHKNGQQVDIRPLRRDQWPKPVTYKDQQYDRDATRLLITSFLTHKNVKTVFFNDAAIVGVHPLAGHDNHFHVQTHK